MSIRFQPPAWSPLSLRTIVRALLARREPAVRTVTERIAREFAGEHVLLVDSGTSALVLAFAAAVERVWRPVALPAYGCYDLATAAIGAGVPVMLYDVDPCTLQPEPSSLARVLERGVSALVVVHLYGYPVPVDDIRRATQAAGALLIEDAAQAWGARHADRQAGTMGDLTILSFGRGKGLTGGGGGALVARGHDGVSALNAISASAAGARRGAAELIGLTGQWLLARPWLYGLPASLPLLGLGETRYHEPWAPRLATTISLAAVAVSWDRAAAEVLQRTAAAVRLAATLELPLEEVRSAAQAEPGYLRLPVRWRGGHRLGPDARRLGIAAAYPRALCDLVELSGCWRNREESCAGARQLARELFTLPTHSRLAPADLVALECWCRQARKRSFRSQPVASPMLKSELESQMPG